MICRPNVSVLLVYSTNNLNTQKVHFEITTNNYKNMKSISLNDQGKIETYVIATIIFTITFLSNFSKELFVEQSGKFEIFGNNLGFILVIGLLWKWKYIREIVSVLTLFVIFVIISSVVMSKSLQSRFLFCWLQCLFPFT